MGNEHFEFWPKRVSKTLAIPETTLFENLEMTVKKYPNKDAIYYYGSSLTYKELLQQVEAVASYMQLGLGLTKGDKVLLFMQNSPQFVVSYYAILRAGAVVVPVNPMCTTEELSFYIQDCRIQHGLVGQELMQKVEPLLETTNLQHLIVAAYNDYIQAPTVGVLPPEVMAVSQAFPNTIAWQDVLNKQLTQLPYEGASDDIIVLPYTSGTTSLPKGCVHTNATVQANTVGAFHWATYTSNSVSLVALPLFHVMGMIHCMNTPVYGGSAMVIMTRWDRDTAGTLMETYGVTHWINISTMLIDFLMNPNYANYDISSLQLTGGGGAALPATIGEKLREVTGLSYVEGYGLSETISQTHFNPPDRPKLQCLGIPSFGVESYIVDPVTLEEVPIGQEGEIILRGPQLFVGYYNRDVDNEASFVTFKGEKFFRTGDIARQDEEGYYFIVDRVKRMINASGYKVWPTEVESTLYKHPAVAQACVVGVPDPIRGENVKAFVILKDDFKGVVSEQEIIEWAKENMAAYKYPRFIEFRDHFPMTSSGKILWRKLQDEEKEAQANV